MTTRDLCNNEYFSCWEYSYNSMYFYVAPNGVNNMEYIACFGHDFGNTDLIYISLLDPTYISDDGRKFTKNEKQIFIEMIQANWDTIRNILIDRYSNYYYEMCGKPVSDKSMYEDKGEINIPISCPDYSVLETED